jgi:3-dehydroquinate synthetase
MIAATLFAVALNRLSDQDAVRILKMIASVGPLPPLGKIEAPQLRPIIAGDKKARGGRVLWVLPRRIGKTEWGVEVPWAIVSRTFAQLPAFAAKARA